MGEIKVWRITSEKYAEIAFSGEGAETYGGRFNSVGTAVVYTSESLALATLELLAKPNERRRLAGRICIPAVFDEDQVIAREKSDLPDAWDARPYTPDSQKVETSGSRTKSRSSFAFRASWSRENTITSSTQSIRRSTTSESTIRNRWSQIRGFSNSAGQACGAAHPDGGTAGPRSPRNSRDPQP